MLRSFELHLPKTLDEALKLYDNHKKEARIVSGGTDLFVEMHEGYKPSRVISINKIKELKHVFIEDDHIHIGPCITHQQILESQIVIEYLNALRVASSKVGSVQTRMRGTIGGNICNAVPSGETLSPLTVLDAQLELTSYSNGSRMIPFNEFFAGPKKTMLMPGELLTDIVIPIPLPRSASVYIKYTRRNAMDLALLGAAVNIAIDEKKDRVNYIRIGLTTAAPVPFVAIKAETYLQGNVLTSETINEAGKLAAQEAKPRSSWRCSEEYRRDVFRILVAQGIVEAIELIKVKGED